MARRSSPPASAPGGSRSRSRTPVPVRTRRTFGDVLKAFVAFLALLVLLVAVPGSLVYFIGWPLPHTVPSLDTLTDEVSVGVFINVLTVVVWLAWAQFTACVLVEVKAAMSGVGLPARVPGAGPSQMLARQLVAAVLLLGSTAASFAPGIAQLGQSYQPGNQPQAAVSAQLTPGQHQGGGDDAAQRQHRSDTHVMGGHGAQQTSAGGQAGDAGDVSKAGAPANKAKATKFYRIQPPEGRHHDSLWEISERHLDDGRRYKEIFRLNKDRVQPDGSKLSEASLIRPGWIMEMPADAHGGELVEMPDDEDRLSKQEKSQLEDYQGNDGDWGSGGGQDSADHGGGQNDGGKDGGGQKDGGRDSADDGGSQERPSEAGEPDADEPQGPNEQGGQEETVDVPPSEHSPDRKETSVPEAPDSERPTRPDDSDSYGDSDQLPGPGISQPDDIGPGVPDKSGPDDGQDGSIADGGIPDSAPTPSTPSGGGATDSPGDSPKKGATKDADAGSDLANAGIPETDGDSAMSALTTSAGDGRGHGRAGTTDRADAPSGVGSVGLPEALAASPLLAAGLLAALGRRRRESLWQSLAGGTEHRVSDDFPPPSDPAAAAHDALFVGADPGAVRFLDRALRGLSEDLADQGRALPVVYAAWLSGEELHLQLAGESGQPPMPWRFGQSASFWTIQRAHTRVDVDGSAAAPYPGLVSLGMRGPARLLLNLESVPGLVSLRGPEEQRTAVLSSVAAELATSGWADRMSLTLVGFGRELKALAPDRVKHVSDVHTLVQTLEQETELRRNALHSAGRSSVLAGRTGEAAQRHQWEPHLVLIGTEPSRSQAERLAALASGADPLGIGFLIGTSADQLPGAVWEFEIDRDGHMRAPQMGLELRAQLLPDELCAAVVELFAGTGRNARTQHGPSFRVDLSDGGRPDVYARLLGPYEILGLEAPEESRSALLHEALAMLLLHRDGVHPRVLASALWPRGVTDDVRDALVDRLVRWLGREADGTPRLAKDRTGRLVLRPSVVSDWDVLRTLHHGATGENGARLSGAVRRRQLADAMELARGPLLADRAEGRYAWLTHELAETRHPLLVVETALALAEEHMRAGDPGRALSTVRAALRTAPSDERLWEQLVRTAHAAESAQGGALLSEAVTWIVERSAQLHGADRGLPPRTRALLDELAPDWRGLRGTTSG